ncbi:MAG TPA: PQQ-binding-like beta-propeller repeat protein [Verrucomicrobiae bacterium]|nr:PQQ-binding-like beta-propeller repeat protein [Verrucomicrobiae bacterium]
MIEITCSCGAYFEVLNEQVAQRVRCPRCGTRASDILAQAEQFPVETDVPPAESHGSGASVDCVNHPGQLATQNCMNCGKPLCMTCVRENGYYCSDECRAAVSAAEPSMATDTEAAGAGDEKMQRAVHIFSRAVKTVALLAAMGGVGYIGYAVYQSKWGPRPRITASLEVMSNPMSFSTVMLDPTRTLVQADDELSLVNLATTQKLWKVDLRPLEEPYSGPKPDSSPGSEYPFDPSKFRDPLRMVDVKGDIIVVQSRRQLVALNAQTGGVKWKFFEPTGWLARVDATDDGVFGVVSAAYTPNAHPRSRAVCWALEDGSQRWSLPDAEHFADAQLTTDNRLVTLTAEPMPSTAGGEHEPEVPTASGLDVGAFKGAMLKKIQSAMAKGSWDIDTAVADDEGQPSAPAKNYVLKFYALASGATQGQTTLALAGVPRVEQVDQLLCVVGRRELFAFADGTEPAWHATLPVTPQLLAAGGDTLAVATKNGVVALDAKSGKQRWSRDPLRAERLYVGPDGVVYVTSSIPRSEFVASEAKTFRIAEITDSGPLDPQAPVTVLRRLDPKTGRTNWGVRNIGREVVFAPHAIFVFDWTRQIRLLANAGPFVTFHSIHCLLPKNGKDLWGYVRTGTLHDHVVRDGKAFLVSSDEVPLGSPQNPSFAYQLCLVERK